MSRKRKDQPPTPVEESKTVTSKEAAEIIGCSPQQVRTLIRNGKIPAKRKKNERNPAGYDLVILRTEAEKYSQTVPRRGWPRGIKRR